MATKDTIEIDVNVGEGVKSMKTLKKEFAEMQTELDGLVPGTQKYIETLQKLGAVKDEIGDLKAEIQAFAGTDAKVAAFGNVIGGIASGFQAAQGAAALFGAESEEVQKALLKVQAASALADGIKGITAMGDSLKVAQNVAKQLVTQMIGVDTYTKIVTVSTRIWNAVMAANPIMLMVAAITALVGAAVLLANAFDDSADATEKYIEANQKQIDQNAEVIRAIDNEITALGGLKANEKDIIALKRERLAVSIENAKLEALNAQAQASKDKELSWYQKIGVAVNELNGVEGTRAANEAKNSEESNKKLKEKIDLVKTLSAEQQAFENEQRQKALDDQKAYNEKAKQLEQERANDAKAFAKEVSDYQEAQRKERLAKEKDEADAKDKAENDAIEAEIQADFNKFEEDKKKRLEATAKYNEEVKASNDAVKEAEGKSIDAMQGLSKAFFAFKSKAAKGNAAEELKIRKQLFQVDKAFNVARAIQDGIRSVQAALTIPPPGGQILAGVNAAIAAANVGVLLASTFDGGSTSSPSIGGGGLGAGASFSQAAPNIAPPQNTTQLNQNGTIAQAPIKAYVVESESAAVTKRVNKLENQSKI